MVADGEGDAARGVPALDDEDVVALACDGRPAGEEDEREGFAGELERGGREGLGCELCDELRVEEW